MSFHALISGILTADPQARDGQKGRFATASIRSVAGEDAVVASVIAFGPLAEQMLTFSKGDALAVSGPAKLNTWTGKDGLERHGISITVTQLAAAKPPSRARPATRRTSRRQEVAAPSVPDDPIGDLWGPAP